MRSFSPTGGGEVIRTHGERSAKTAMDVILAMDPEARTGAHHLTTHSLSRPWAGCHGRSAEDLGRSVHTPHFRG